MSVDPELLRLLRERAGLRTQALEGESGAALIRRRMQAVGIDSVERYRDLVHADSSELGALVAAVAVPETWFFRYLASCEWLVEWLRTRRRDAPADATLQILSAPCATGQEPISLAVCAAAAGWATDTIEVHAIDASAAAVSTARDACQRPLPLRDPLPEWAEAWFESREGGVVPDRDLFNRIRFEQADLRDWRPVPPERFDVVACRNLLIYLEPESRRRVMRTCDACLASDGVLLLGHADHDRDLLAGFETVGVTQSFAHRRREEASPHPPGPAEVSSEGARPASARRSPSAVGGVIRRDAGRGDPIPKSTLGGGRDSVSRMARARGANASAASTEAPSTESASSPWPGAAHARALADAGRIADAEQRCRDRLAEHPSDRIAIELLGCTRLAQGDLAEAGELFRRLVYLAPNHVEGLLHLGSIAEREGDAEQAARLRDRARRASRVVTPRTGGLDGGAAA